MRLVVCVLMLFVVGCSTAPIADALDYCFPARVLAPSGRYYGGVTPADAPIEPAIAPAPGDPLLFSESP